MLPRDALDPEQVVFSACTLRQGEQGSPGTIHGWGQRGDPLRPPGVDSREARLCSSASSSSARGILPGREGGDGTPREQISKEKERPASRSALQVGARGVWEFGDSGLGAALPPRNSHSKLAVTTLSPSLKREALGRQA